MEDETRTLKLFLSYRFADEPFVQRINYHLRKQEKLEMYCYADERHVENWVPEVSRHLAHCYAFLLFLGDEIGGTQEREAQTAIEDKKRLFLIKLPGASPLPETLDIYRPADTIPVPRDDEASARECAIRITVSLLGAWMPDDDLPIGYPFDYEKKIIEEYSKGEISGERIAQGCPRVWPRVTKNEGAIENRVQGIGLYRDWDYDKDERKEQDPQVVAAGLTSFNTDQPSTQRLTLPEAGPRKFLHYPTRSDRKLRVGVLVSGGIAPGINAVITGIVERQFLYAERGNYGNILRVRGYHNGLSALYRDGVHHSLLNPQSAASQANLGGSMLGTSRGPEFMDPARSAEALENVARRLFADGVEILYIIGGDGSMRAAHAIWKTAQYLSKTTQFQGKNLSVVGIPKTMDNDILWVWQSFGFLSAVEWSKEAIQQLHTEAQSNPRLCVIQLFGSDSGFVVTHAVAASGVCDLFLIPEAPFKMKGISGYMTDRLKRRYEASEGLESTYGLIVMAETAIPLDAEDYLEDPNVGLTEEEKSEIRSFLKKRRLFGQTPDALRSGGLKLVSRVLQQNIRTMEGDYWQRFRVFTNEPRHLIRAIPPSSSDIIFGHRLGSLAVDCAMAGYTDFMISQWMTEYVMVPLRTVTLGRKRIPKDGIFYNSARARTGQPGDLT